MPEVSRASVVLARTVKENSEREMVQLIKDIKRIGDGKSVTFGALFDDEQVQDFYEALIGTLKGAKKKKLIDFPGQFLLKGQHDKVEIILVEGGKPLKERKTTPLSAPISPVAPGMTKVAFRSAAIATKFSSSFSPRSSPKRNATCAGISNKDIIKPSDLPAILESMPRWCQTTCNGVPVIRYSFRAKDFASAMIFLNKVAEIAETEGHHPDLHLTNYREVGIILYTHKVKGVTPLDVALAKLIDKINVEPRVIR